MFNSHAIPNTDSSVSVARHPVLVAWAALAAVAATALVLALTVGFGPGTSPQSRSANPLPQQVRDTPPSATSATQIDRAAVPAGYVRDPRTHQLLSVQTPSAGQATSTGFADSPAMMRERNVKLGR